MSKTLIYLFFLTTMIACPSNTTEQMNNQTINPTVQKYVDHTTDPDDIAFMQKMLREIIQEWTEKYSNMGFYSEENFKIADQMIFGKDKDKVLVIAYCLLEGTNDGEAKLLAGQLNDDDKWDFRFTGMPSFYYEYNESLRKGVKFTEEEILARTFNHLIEDGLISFYDEISQDYIKNKWF